MPPESICSVTNIFERGCYCYTCSEKRNKAWEWKYKKERGIVREPLQHLYGMIEFDIDPTYVFHIDSEERLLNLKNFHNYKSLLEDLVIDAATLRQRSCFFLEGKAAAGSPRRVLTAELLRKFPAGV